MAMSDPVGAGAHKQEVGRHNKSASALAMDSSVCPTLCSNHTASGIFTAAARARTPSHSHIDYTSKWLCHNTEAHLACTKLPTSPTGFLNWHVRCPGTGLSGSYLVHQHLNQDLAHSRGSTVFAERKWETH